VFDTFGPGNTYSQLGGFDVGNVFPYANLEAAAQFTAGASGNLTTVDLGLTYDQPDGFVATPVDVYLAGSSGSPFDPANETFLGSTTPIGIYGFTNNSVVSFAVAGTVPVTMGSIYRLVVKPSTTNGLDVWNTSLGQVPGVTNEAYTLNGVPAIDQYAFLPAFRLTAPIPTPVYAAQLQQPINADNTSVFNVRRGVIPVKFTLSFNGVVTCDLPQATIVVTRTAGGTVGPIDESTYSGPADTGSNFRIDSCQYVYNLSASALGMGTYRVDILINGQVVGSATFQLR
jgi:hypothetical protein